MSDYIIGIDKVAMPNRIESIKTQRGESADAETAFRALTIGNRSQGPNAAEMRNMKALTEEILVLQQDLMELTTEYMQAVLNDFINVDEN